MLVAVEDPDDDPAHAEERDRREQHTGKGHDKVAVVAEQPMTQGATRMNSAVGKARPSSISHSMVEATRQARLAPALEELAEDGHERGRERRVGGRARERSSGSGTRP